MNQFSIDQINETKQKQFEILKNICNFFCQAVTNSIGSNPFQTQNGIKYYQKCKKLNSSYSGVARIFKEKEDNPQKSVKFPKNPRKLEHLSFNSLPGHAPEFMQ